MDHHMVTAPFNLHVYLAGLGVILALAVITWLLSVAKRDVSIVDSLWSILFLGAIATYIYVNRYFGDDSPRAALLLVLVAAWALRLAIYLTARNWRQPEDYRYQQIRARNQ